MSETYEISDPQGVSFSVVGWEDAWQRFTDMLARTRLSGTFQMRRVLSDVTPTVRPIVADLWLDRPE